MPPSPQRDLKELRAAVDRIIDDHNIGHPYRLPVFSLYGTSRAIDIPHYRLRPARVPNVFRRLAGLEGALNTSADFRRA
ncbi:MAG: ATPase, partial [Planctomycetota bacterium]|nr:ATPase [Planctomycetota bacterium]